MRNRRSLPLVGTTALLLLAGAASAQVPQGEPTNKAPNPYTTIAGWAKMPEGRVWGSTSGVGIDRDGTSIWVAERCGANSCVGSNLAPILKFDAHGNLVRSFGEGLVQVPHGLFVDRDGNVWITDWSNSRGTQNGAVRDSTKGHQVMKFSPDGKLLLTLGKPGGGREPDFFWQPNAVVTAPNGDIYVAEGHTDAPTANARILKFDKDGRFLRSWGKRGNGDGELLQPHALAMDSRGRLFIGDRSNNRIVIVDKDFNHLASWHQFSRPSGIYIDANDVIYVADSESGSVAPNRKDWLRGIRIGSAKDGSVTAFIPDPDTTQRSTSSAEGVAVDRNGVIYGAEVGQRAL
ncbi:MAG TPA: peptidyl-alpha-hydroxyglycine alpha-amidating lyase family protein, partial [Gemmatimonadaceae bacterium]|nr:peptidyl-alpha-hydroxyglycine alpha-amidating lyase family protein [Gemmatimonadaceae bacterium]